MVSAKASTKIFDWVAQFGPASVAQFGPAGVAHFGPAEVAQFKSAGVAQFDRSLHIRQNGEIVQIFPYLITAVSW